MQEGRQITRIPLERGASLPRREAPAGYVIVIEDVEYGNRFKIARLQEVNREQVRRAADVPFETKLRLIIEAPNAGVVAQDLHDRFVAPGESGEWFDLDDAQVAQLDEIGRPQEMSLRDLALNAAGGDSLVQDAKIVETRAESPFVHLQRREQRPARRATAWILLTVIVIGGILVAENAPLIRREISRLFATQSQPSVEIRSVPATISSSVAGDTRPNLGPAQSPTAVQRKREVFFVTARARARTCASTHCSTAAVLDIGTRIEALSYHIGRPVAGDKVWIKFLHGGALLYLNQSSLSLTAPIVEATAEPTTLPELSPTVTATLTETPLPSATAAHSGTSTAAAILIATATASATPTATDTPTATVTATDTPTVTPTDQPAPTATATVASAAKYVVETARNLNANIRICPRTSCDIVAKLPAGAPVEVLGSVTGETVNETNVWFEIKLEDGSAYIHSELAEVSALSQPSSSSASLERFSSPSRKYTRSRVNVRTGPGTHYPLLDYVPAGTALEVVGQSGDWYLIRRGGREDYIAGWLTHDAPLPVSREAQGSGSQNTVENAPIGQVAVAVQVIDGDTIDVRLDRGTVRVRYIGVDTPERGEPCYAEATNYNRSLVQGKTLTLVRDTSDYGPYGRLLRYVYADGVFVNLALVQAGYAKASYYAPNGRHRHEFESAQRSAPSRGCAGAPIQANRSQAASPPVDNCCFIGWQCKTEEEWKNGYFAFQNNQCNRSSQPAQSSQQQYSCNCSKTCEQLSSCAEARFQLNNCGCNKRDRDKDGIPCESICG